MKNKSTKLRCARLLAALLAGAAPSCAQAQQSAGGDYSLESSVVDNGGGAWLEGGRYASRGAIGQPLAPSVQSKGGAFSSRAGFYNPAYLTYQKGQASSLTLFSGKVELAMPAGAVTDRDVFDIGINRDDIKEMTGMDPEHPFLVEKAVLDEANRKMAAREGPWAQFALQDLTEMYIFDEQSLSRDALTKAGQLSLEYRDEDNDGVVDFSDPPVLVETLETWGLDEKTKLWSLLPNLGVDKEKKKVTVNFQGPGVYSMIGALAKDTDRVFAYPVPFRPNGPNAGTGAGQTGTEADGILFRDLPQKGDISIFTLSGQLVRKIDIASSMSIGSQGVSVRWNVKTMGGSRVASGVYIWRVSSGSNAKTGKLMIIW